MSRELILQILSWMDGGPTTEAAIGMEDRKLLPGKSGGREELLDGLRIPESLRPALRKVSEEEVLLVHAAIKSAFLGGYESGLARGRELCDAAVRWKERRPRLDARGNVENVEEARRATEELLSAIDLYETRR